MAASHPRPRSRLLRWGRRAAVGLLGFLLLATIVVWFSTAHFRAFGGSASGATLARMRASPHFQDNRFVNLESTSLMAPRAYGAALSEWLNGQQMRVPTCPLPLVGDTAARLATPPPSGLRITWLGHSTTLLEVDGTTLLTDPMWSDRASPLGWVGPRRYHAPPLAFEALPHLDAVLISHEHYDHLDMATVQRLAALGVPFHVPLGIGAHLAAWGVPAAQIVEHDWWEAAALPNGVRVVSTPARHFNGRGVPWRVGALWTSWSIVGPRHRVFFSGDTGLSEALREIAAREGPFDVALFEIGQYHPSWGNIHLGPIGALDAFARINAKVLVPIHWSTFVLAYHAWSEPAEVLFEEAARRGVSLATPRLGQPIEVAGPSPTETTPWWRALPPQAAACP